MATILIIFLRINWPIFFYSSWVGGAPAPGAPPCLCHCKLVRRSCNYASECFQWVKPYSLTHSLTQRVKASLSSIDGQGTRHASLRLHRHVKHMSHTPSFTQYTRSFVLTAQARVRLDSFCSNGGRRQLVTPSDHPTQRTQRTQRNALAYFLTHLAHATQEKYAKPQRTQLTQATQRRKDRSGVYSCIAYVTLVAFVASVRCVPRVRWEPGSSGPQSSS